MTTHTPYQLKSYSQLEIELIEAAEETFLVMLRARDSVSPDERRPIPKKLRLNIPSSELKGCSSVKTYGKLITEKLLGGPAGMALMKELGDAEAQKRPLRLRLKLDTESRILHTLRWELLQHPVFERFLATNERVFICRAAASERRLADPPTRPKLRVLIVVAAPSGLEKYKLGKVEVETELDAARPLFNAPDVSVDILASGLKGQRVTLTAIVDMLRGGDDTKVFQGDYDIIYLVAHGTVNKALEESVLWLENDDGGPAKIGAELLVEKLDALVYRPRLVVLASCQSAGLPDSGDSMVSLGARLADIGIAAVVAMHGNVTMAGIHDFAPTFFRELLRDGEIERALSVARSAIYPGDDWWRPVLFLAAADGHLWTTLAQASPEPQVVHATDMAMLSALLLRVSEWTTDTLVDAFRKSLPSAQAPELLRTPLETLALMIRNLGDMPQQLDDTFPILSFVERLAVSVEEHLAEEMRTWVDMTAANLGIPGIFTANFRAMIASESPITLAPLYLTISLTPDEGHRTAYLVQAWIGEAGGDVTCIYSDEDSRSLNDFGDLLSNLCQQAAAYGPRIRKRLVVEICMPCRLFDVAIDELIITDGNERVPIGSRYRVIVRYQERVDNPHLLRKASDQWARFIEVGSLLKPGALSRFEHTGPFQESEIRTQLIEKGAVGVLLAPRLGQRQHDDRYELAKAMLNTGLSFAIWIRPPAWGSDLLTQLYQNPPANHLALWEWFHNQRAMAWGKIGASPAQHMTVIWDDPTRPPPDALGEHYLVAP